MRSDKTSDEIKLKLKELYIALRLAYKILTKAFLDKWNFYHTMFYSSLFFNNNNKMKQIDVYYTDIREGKFKLKDGIYPIIEITSDKTPKEIVVFDDLELTVIKEPSLNITILQEPSNKVRIVRILDDGTCKADFIKNWENLIVAFSGKRSTNELEHSVMLLVVEEGKMRIEILNAMEKIERYGEYYFIPHLFDFGKQFDKIYMLSDMLVKLIEDVLWEDNLVGALKKFANKIFTYDMFEASIKYLTVRKEADVPVENDRKLKKLSEKIQKNPSKYPLPISTNMVWIKFEDWLLGKHKLPSQFFLITQWHINSKILTPPDEKISYHNCIVLNNEIVIYDVPDVFMDHYMNKYGGHPDEWFYGSVADDNPQRVRVWITGIGFIWPNGTFTLLLLPYLFNIYLNEGENILYIPKQIETEIMKGIEEVITKKEKEIRSQARQQLKEAERLKEQIISKLIEWKQKKLTREKNFEYPNEWEVEKKDGDIIKYKGEYTKYKVISDFCPSQKEKEKEKEVEKTEQKEVVEKDEQSRTIKKSKSKNKEEKISEPQQEQEEKEEKVEEIEEQIKEQDIMEELKDADVEVEAKVKSKVQITLPKEMVKDLIVEKPKREITKKNQKKLPEKQEIKKKVFPKSNKNGKTKKRE